MKISAILSSRSFEKNPNYHLIYEWEEDIATELKLPIVDAKPTIRKFLLNRYSKLFLKVFGNTGQEKLNNFIGSITSDKYDKGYNFVFELYVGTEPDFATAKNSVPLMVDFWKHTDLENFYKVYQNCRLVLISSLEAFNYLKANNCPLPIEHLGLSLSDRYRMDRGSVYSKKYDILLAGRLNIRTNQILRNYLEIFIKKYPNTEYLYQEEINGEYYYVSNKRGNIGKFHSRQDYIDLLRASKISFYSTPGIDGGEIRTGGFNPVTPRFLELLSAQCLLIGKYPANEETSYYELDKVCPNVESYEEFEAILLKYLNQKSFDFTIYEQILSKHYTSVRAKKLKDIVKIY